MTSTRSVANENVELESANQEKLCEILNEQRERIEGDAEKVGIPEEGSQEGKQ